jgi:hypothetical protein
MNYLKSVAFLIAIGAAGPACEQDKPDSTITPTPSTITLAVELVDVAHSGHVYVVDVVHGHFIHSPACPYDVK